MPRTGPVISHWYALVDGFNTSAGDFYQEVAGAIHEREGPELGFSRLELKEGGIASAKRESLAAPWSIMETPWEYVPSGWLPIWTPPSETK